MAISPDPRLHYPDSSGVPDQLQPHAGAMSRARAAQKVHLLANHLGVFGYSDALAISLALNCKLASAENDIRRWAKAGLVRVCRVSSCQVPLIIGTDKLFVYASANLHARWGNFPFLTHPSRIPLQFLTHHILARVSVSLMLRDGDFGDEVVEIVPDRMMKRWMQRDRIPSVATDGLLMKHPDTALLLKSARPIAIEQEEHGKSPEDRQRIICQYSRLIQMGYFSRVIYMGTSETVMELYRRENQADEIGMWHYNHDAKKWMRDTEFGNRDQHTVWKRDPALRKCFKFDFVRGIARRYYPYLQEDDSEQQAGASIQTD